MSRSNPALLLSAAVLVALPHLSAAAVATIPYGVSNSPAASDAGRNSASEVLSISLPYEARPVSGANSVWETDAEIYRDKDTLHVRVFAKDDVPSSLRATQSRNDNIRELDDKVSLYIVSSVDSRRAYVFTVNALGVRADSIESSVGDGAPFWNGDWQSSAEIVDGGYVVTFGIPLDVVGIEQNADGSSAIRLNITRQIGRGRQELLSASPLSDFAPCRECQYASFSLAPGDAPRSDKNTLRIQPYVLASSSAEYDYRTGKATSRSSERDAGVDIRWQFSPSDVVVATVNPDFSQVEIDGIQFQINERFARSLTERRPFFTNESSVFNTALPLVYTRSMVSPDAGLQYVHRASGFEAGLLAVSDAVTSIVVPTLDSSSVVFSDASSRNIAARGKWRLPLAESRLGTLITHRSSGAYRNNVTAFDYVTDLGSDHTLSAQAAYSNACDPIGTVQAQGNQCISGSAVQVEHTFGTDEWFSDTSVSRLSPEFRADLGRVNQVGVFDILTSAGRFWKFGSDRPIQTAALSTNAFRQESVDGDLLIQSVSLVGSIRTKTQNHSLRLAKTEEVAEGIPFQLGTFLWSSTFRPRTQSTVMLQLSGGDGIYYSDLTKGRRLTAAASFNATAGAKLEGSFVVSTSRFWVDGETVFRTSLGELRSEYHLSEKNHVGAIVSYGESRVYRSPGDPRTLSSSDSLNYQLTYQYRPSAFRYFIVGLSGGALATVDFPDLAPTRRYAFAKWVMDF